MRFLLRFTLAASFGLSLMQAPVQASWKTENLNITVRINDNTYCPNGRMTGREGRTEGRDDTVTAKIYVKTVGNRRFRIRRSENVRLRVTCHRKNGQEIARSTFRLTGYFNRRNKRVRTINFRPPQQTGEYTVRVSLGGTTRDSTPFAVWYDRDACPRRQVRPPRPPPPPPPPEPPEPKPDLAGAKCLNVTFRASWNCDNGNGTARVTVRNTHKTKSVQVDGISSSGIRGLGGWQCVSGDHDPLAPGDTATFAATGTFSSGTHDAQVWVSNHPAARDGSRLEVNCGPDYEDLNK